MQSKKKSKPKAEPSAAEELKRLYTAKLKSSGLTVAEAERHLQYKLLTAAQVAALNHPAAPGFILPYLNAGGKPSGFYRLRYLKPPQVSRVGGFSALVATESPQKELRYIQPPAAVPEVYLPHGLGTDWSAALADTKTPLFITEGELKAAAATKHGLPTLGLGGVWCWKSKRSYMAHLPFFDATEWHGREVTIVFDSDSVFNPLVQLAQNALAEELIRLGAAVIISKLPTTTGSTKTGLDDLIVSAGAEEAKRIIFENSDYYESIKPLRELNAEVVYIRDPGLIVRLDNNQRINCKAFVDHAYSDRLFAEEVPLPDGKGSRTVVKCAPKEWLKWPQRSVAERIVYAPGDTRFTAGGEYNTWSGWGCEPRKGDITPWKKLLDFLFAGRDGEAARRWFEQWAAYPLQHPGTKMYTAVLIWSVGHGMGKSLVAHTLFRLYGENCAEIGDDEIETGRNDWAAGVQFVLADDILSEGARKKSFAENLRRMITREKIWIDIKWVPKYSITDCITYYLTSNHPDAVYLEDRDRRMFIWEVTGTPLPMEFYNAYRDWKNSEVGAAALFHHLLYDVDTATFNPHAPAPETASKLEMIQAGRSDLSTWVHAAVADPDLVLSQPYALWTTEELLLQYDPTNYTRVTKNGMGKELKRTAVPEAVGGQQVRAGGYRTKVWILRDVAELLKVQSPAKLAKLYADERTKHHTKKFKEAAK